MNRFAKLGGVLGIVYCVAGFVLVFLGWNGAASNDSESSQFPYLISGGIAGLGLVVVGAALMVAHSLRTDRVELRSSIDELRTAVERIGVGSGSGTAGASAAAPTQLAGTADVDTGADTSGAADTVVASPESYHRPDCTVVEGQAELQTMTRDDAAASGRTPCRVCQPDG